MSTPILYVMTDNSAVGIPSTDEVNPLLGYKNPNGVGAFLLSGLVVNTSTGPQLLQTRTDSQYIAESGTPDAFRPVLPVRSTLFAYDAVGDSNLPLCIAQPQDAQDLNVTSTLAVTSFLQCFNGLVWDQLRTASAANLASFSGIGSQISSGPGEWAVNSEPAVTTQATATRAAGGVGVRNVCKSLHFSLAAVAAQTIISARVRDGVTGAGTILWSQQVIAPAGTVVLIELSGLNIVGSANTAMTFEWSGAPVATNFQTAGGTGYLAS